MARDKKGINNSAGFAGRLGRIIKTPRGIFIIAILSGAAFWIVDSAFDYWFFYDASFLQLLATDLPPHEPYFRLAVFAVFCLAGVVAAKLIAQRERAVNMASEKVHLNQILLDRMPFIVLLLRSHSREIVVCNKTAAEFGAVVGGQCFRTWPRLSEPCSWCKAQEVWSDGQTRQVEVEAGGRTWDISWVPVSDDMYLHYALDVTERKRGQQALRESEERFRLLYQRSPLAYQSLDNEGNFVEVNPAWLEMLGYQRREVIGKWFGDFVTPEGRELFPERFEHFKAVGRIDSLQYTMVGKDRKQIDVEIDSGIGYDEQGKFKQTHCILRDITERKCAEEMIAKSNRILAQKNEELESVVRVVSHDLRSPLVNICGFAEELTDCYKRAESALKTKQVPKELSDEFEHIFAEDAHQAIGFIRSNAEKMNLLINALLDFARLGRAAAIFETVDVSAMVRSIARNMAYQLQQSGVQLAIGRLPKCLGDKVQINQVFSNLLTNAVKYRDPARPGVIKVSGKRQQDKVLYCVEDNGCGIAAKDHERIFEIFSQVDPNHTDGQGLGLAIIRRIVNRHNGSVWVESRPGKGSNFFVSLPAK